MIKYGHISSTVPFSTHSFYNKNARDFYHPFSAKSFGYTFGSGEYIKMIPLVEYLSLPIDIIDDVLEGVAEGEKYVIKERKRLADKVAKENKGINSEADKIMKGYK